MTFRKTGFPVIIGGKYDSGKTEIAKILAKKLNYRYIDEEEYLSVVFSGRTSRDLIISKASSGFNDCVIDSRLAVFFEKNPLKRIWVYRWLDKDGDLLLKMKEEEIRKDYLIRLGLDVGLELMYDYPINVANKKMESVIEEIMVELYRWNAKVI